MISKSTDHESLPKIFYQNLIFILLNPRVQSNPSSVSAAKLIEMFKLFSIWFFLSISAKLCHGQGTICTYVLSETGVYTCRIDGQTILNDENMLPVTGIHLPGYGVENVTLLSSFRSTITVFPSPVVDNFRNVQQIYLSSQMHTFNRSLTNCDHLDFLFLSFNNFSTFSGGIFENCLRLTTLTLDWSFIDNIEPDAFVGLSSLQNLSLSNNRINELTPGTFAPLSSLLFLDLSNNNIEKLSTEVFSSLTLLRSLSLRDNYISTWYSTILTNVNLTSLDLSRNNITAILGDAFENLPNLQTLTLGNRNFDDGLAEIPIFTGLRQLETFILSENIIRNVSADSFRNLANLRNLDLSSNRIETLDFEMQPDRRFDRLERLSIWNNWIRNIPDNTFTALVNLNDLDLSHNLINRLSGRSINPIKQMRRLQVSYNLIWGIQRSLFDEVSLLEFQAFRNPCFDGIVHINNTIDNNDFEDRVVPLLSRCFNFASTVEINTFLLMALLAIVRVFSN